MSDDCPCCKLISIALRSEGTPRHNGWYAILQYEGKGIRSLLKSDATVLDERVSGHSPLFLELYLIEDWVHNSAIWISFESNEAYRRRRACPTPTITFDIPNQINIPLLRSWIDECDSHGHFPGGSAGDNSRSQQVHRILLIDVRKKMLVQSSLLPQGKMAPYFALSYVWGPTRFFKTTNSNIKSLLFPGGLAAPGVNLPKTFLDAMKLAEIPSNQELELELGLMPDWWRSENAFFSAVENYTKRTLSYDEDIIDAFSGALERMKEMGYRPQGDPTMDITSPNALLWFSVKRNAIRRPRILDSEATIYPSWSWTGWRGAITYASLKFGRNASFRTVTLRWSHRYKPAGMDVFHSLEAEHTYGADRYEPVTFCTQPFCSQLLDLARAEPHFNNNNNGDNQYPQVRHLNLYRFRTSVCTMSNFSCSSWISYVHRRSTPHIGVRLMGIHDRDDRRCGFLFNPPEFDPPLSSPHNEEQRYFLITVSMKKQHNWLENIPGMDYNTGHWPNSEKECTCCLNIMLVKESEEYDGLVERMAVGQMYPQAWADAEPIFTTVTMM
ncbi:hypothetical protein PMIN03_005022 [Paraphaeosphaeria minitans]